MAAEEMVRQMGDDLEILRGGRLAVGAEVLSQGGVHFRIWASRCTRVAVVIEGALESGNTGLVATLMPEETDISRVLPLQQARARCTAINLTIATSYIQIQPPAFSRMDHMALHRSLIRPRSNGLMGCGQGFVSRGKSFTRCTSAPLLRQERGRLPAKSCQNC
jgi:hypothetical protein